MLKSLANSENQEVGKESSIFFEPQQLEKKPSEVVLPNEPFEEKVSLYYCQYCPFKVQLSLKKFKAHHNKYPHYFFYQCFNSEYLQGRQGDYKKNLNQIVIVASGKSCSWKKFTKLKRQDRHKDKFYIQNRYRETELKKVIESSGLGHWKETEEKTALESGNYLKINLKKSVYKNLDHSSYIYKTSFFLHTHGRSEEAENNFNSRPNCPFGEEYFSNPSKDDSLVNYQENNPSHTKTNQKKKNSKFTKR